MTLNFYLDNLIDHYSEFLRQICGYVKQTWINLSSGAGTGNAHLDIELTGATEQSAVDREVLGGYMYFFSHSQ